MKKIEVKYNPNYPHFGIVEYPVEHKQHQNQQRGRDIYVRVINFDTGETCFKKTYENKTGVYFKHSGYSPMYIEDFTAKGTVIPFQVVLDVD